MITVIPYATLGHADHGWLDARHHFSFADYYNPTRMGFGALRVINDDRIAAGRGFGTHPHRDMEIITYVRSGAITHKDSLGNEGRTGAGDVQVMSAGSGVAHSEHNLEEVETTLYQIWIEPNAKGITPRWDAAPFPKEPVTKSLTVLVSGMAHHKNSGALFIHQDAAIYGGRLHKGTIITQPLSHMGYILASNGSVEVGGVLLQKGDGAEVRDDKLLTITALCDAEILILDVPSTPK